jgi:hypothetical protein
MRRLGLAVEGIDTFSVGMVASTGGPRQLIRVEFGTGRCGRVGSAIILPRRITEGVIFHSGMRKYVFVLFDIVFVVVI